MHMDCVQQWRRMGLLSDPLIVGLTSEIVVVLSVVYQEDEVYLWWHIFLDHHFEQTFCGAVGVPGTASFFSPFSLERM